MHVLSIIATDVGIDGAECLLAGDRAAVSWGVELAETQCRVECPMKDDNAAAYSQAAGARLQRRSEWDEPIDMAFDVVLLGPGAINYYGDRLAGKLADLMVAELLFNVLHVRREQQSWKVICDAGRGAQDIVTTEGPVVLVVSLEVPRPRYVSQYRLNEARRCTGTEAHIISSRPLSAIPWQPVTPRPPRATCGGTADAQTRADQAFGIGRNTETAGERTVITEEPGISAKILLRYLVHQGFVVRTLPTLGEELTSRAVPGQTSEKAVEVPAAPRRELYMQKHEGDGFTEATYRYPRGPGDMAARQIRRPRRCQLPAASQHRPVAARLLRGPRRLQYAVPPGSRGPFLITGPALSGHKGRHHSSVNRGAL